MAKILKLKNKNLELKLELEQKNKIINNLNTELDILKLELKRLLKDNKEKNELLKEK